MTLDFDRIYLENG